MRYDSLIKKYSESDKRLKRSVKDAFTSTKDMIKSSDTSGVLSDQDTITRYLQQIVARIQAANPQIKNRKFLVFTNRSSIPNAFNLGAGIIFMNLGLLARLESEDELAFIIAHEMSHDIKDHVENSLIRLTEIQNDEEYKKELKKISKQTFGKARSEVYLKLKYLSKYTGAKRECEIQADSLGQAFLFNAGYDTKAAIRTMHVLDSVDMPAFRKPVNYSKYLNFSSYPFKDSWLMPEEDESIGGNISSMVFPDSLKTHPDCKVRISELEKQELPKKNVAMRPGLSSFDYYRTRAAFELIEYNMEEFQFSEALYQSLQMLEVYPENVYLRCAAVNCLYELYIARKEHYYFFVTDFPREHYGDAYYKFLVYLYNVNSEVLKNQAIQFFNANLKTSSASPFAAYVALLLKSIELKPEEAAGLPAQYSAAYNDKYFLKELNYRFKPKSKK